MYFLHRVRFVLFLSKHYYLFIMNALLLFIYLIFVKDLILFMCK